MSIVWVPRTTWGASTATELFIAGRVTDDPNEKTEIQVHHSASVDSDDTTPNRWDYDEAVTYMKRLQWVRPDLGPLPYSENLAVSEDLDTVWVFEGRGILTRGAHTGGHNVPGVGWGVFGNFDLADPDAAAVAVAAIQSQAIDYRATITPNLGDTKNPAGWDAWGHRDTSSKTCPGRSLYPLLANFSLEADEMTPEQLQEGLAAFFQEITQTKSDGSVRKHLVRISDSVWAAEVGRGDQREFLSSVLVQARSYARSDFLNGDGDVDPAELSTAIADAVEEAGIADQVADELSRRLAD